MAQAKKTNWKLFINESIVLVLHLTLAVFFCRIAVSVNELYHAQLQAVAAVIVSMCFLLPLLMHVVDLWARLLAAVREEKFAVKLLEFSITWHKKLFGENNAFMSEKTAMLADIYYDWEKKEEARSKFDQAWKQYKNSSLKLPPLHPSFSQYAQLLEASASAGIGKASIATDGSAGILPASSAADGSAGILPASSAADGSAGILPASSAADGSAGILPASSAADGSAGILPASSAADGSAGILPASASKHETALAQEIRSELRKTSRWLIGQRTLSFAITVPTIVFMLSIHALEAQISEKNSEMRAVESLKGINALAKMESAVLGPNASALVYADYASAFEDATQYAEMTWCVNKAIEILQKIHDPEPVLTLTLLNQKALGLILTNKTEEARKGLLAAMKLANTLSDSKFSVGGWSRKYKIRKEKEKAELHLAELERLEGNYQSAEELYLRACGLKADMSWVSTDTTQNNENTPAQPKVNQPESPWSNKVVYATKVVDTIQLIDKLHKLQHIEMKLDHPLKALLIQKRICELLDRSYSLEQLSERPGNELDFGVREASRELDVCSLMLAEAGQTKESEKYREKAEALRNKHSRTLNLNAAQQDSLVDICTTVTNGLLAAKYRSDNWKETMGSLVKDELSSKGAQSSLARLPWYDNESLKKDSPQKSKIGKLEVNISPLSIRNSPDGAGIAVDVQGVVKIYSREKSADPEEQKFNFAYLVKDANTTKPRKAVIEGFLDNQPITSFQLD
jgi:tetratricopeptide (TPR) repeat protein